MEESSDKMILSENKNKTGRKLSVALMIWRFLWLGVSAILEVPLSLVCFLGIVMFRKWTDKMMIMAFCLMFLGWFVISIIFMVRTKRKCKWVIIPQLWLKMAAFTAAMTIFYLFAPVYPAALGMAALTLVMIFSSIYIEREMTGRTNYSMLRKEPELVDFVYFSEGKSEWISAFFLWLCESNLCSMEFMDRIGGEEFSAKLKAGRIPPRKLFEACGRSFTDKDCAPSSIGFTRAFFLVGTPESVRMLPFLDGYEEVLERVLTRHHLEEDSEFDPAVYGELKTELDLEYENYRILQERIITEAENTGRPLPPTRLMQRNGGEIEVYAHLKVPDQYLKACLEDFDHLNAGIRERVEAFQRVLILIYPPHGEDRVFVIRGENKKKNSEDGVALIVRNGTLFRAGRPELTEFQHSPWVLIRKGMEPEEDLS